MKKEILIFGSVVVLCLGVTAFALRKPKVEPATTDLSSSSADLTSSSSDLASTSLAGNDPSGTPGSLSASDGFSSSGSSTFPPSADLNPNRPFDSSPSLGPSLTPSPSTSPSLPPGNPFPGSSLPGGSTASTSFGLTPSPAPLEPLPLPTSETKTHTVKKGEVLGDISRRHYGSSKHWRKIAAANNIQGDGLKEGMTLTIPPLEVAPVTTEAATSAGAGTYVVKKGDSYYKIAKKELGDASRFKELEKLNGIAAEDLHEGQKLILPAVVSADSQLGALPGPELTGGRTHTVAEGEYLSDISKRYYGSTKHWQEIVKANPGVSPERLKVGQKLAIPELAGVGSSTAGSATAGAGEYVVKKGDTFESIAGKTLGDKNQWRKIQDVNPGVDPGALKIGQKIKLPSGVTTISEPSGLPAPTLAPTPVPLPSPSFPAPIPPAGGSLPPANDPWAIPAPSTGSSGTSGTGGTGATGTSTTYDDPWKGFSTTTGTGTRP